MKPFLFNYSELCENICMKIRFLTMISPQNLSSLHHRFFRSLPTRFEPDRTQEGRKSAHGFSKHTFRFSVRCHLSGVYPEMCLFRKTLAVWFDDWFKFLQEEDSGNLCRMNQKPELNSCSKGFSWSIGRRCSIFFRL
jgi:hypothetical protein